MKSFYKPVVFESAGEVFRVEGNIFLAPIAGYSDRAFRSVCVREGASLTYTEMVSSEALVRNSEKTETLLLSAPNETHYAVQLFGSVPEVMAEAALLIEKKYSPFLLDVNAGCPVPKITKTGAGSALTHNPDALYAILSAMIRTLRANGKKTPVTVKIRSGWDAKNMHWKEAALAAKAAGVSAIAIHPRTRAQGYEGKADWPIIGELVSLMGDLPVFGSGDLFSSEDALAMLQKTGCAAVMFARGAMGNPFIFSETRALLQGNEYVEVLPEQRVRVGLEELRLLSEDKGELAACREMRKRFCAYVKGFEGAKELKRDIVAAESIEAYDRIFTQFCS